MKAASILILLCGMAVATYSDDMCRVGQSSYPRSVEFAEVFSLLIPFQDEYYVYKSNDEDWHSNSMAPTFGIGNTLILEESPANLGVGDIVSMRDGDFGATHRIVSINDTCIVTRGDNNKRGTETWCDRSSVKYRVIGIIFTK